MLLIHTSSLFSLTHLLLAAPVAWAVILIPKLIVRRIKRVRSRRETRRRLFSGD